MPKLYDMFGADTVEPLVRSISLVLNEGVLVAGPTGELIWHNPVVPRLFHMSPDELLGRRLDDEAWHAITLDGAPYPFGDVRARLSASVPKGAISPIGIRTGDSRLKWFSISISQVDVDGEPHMIVVLSDVTAQIVERRALARTLDVVRNSLATAELPDSDVVRFAAARSDGGGDTNVAADFFDVTVEDEIVRFSIGDSSGSGAGAVDLSLTARTSMRAISGIVPGPADVVDRLDTVIDDRGPRHGVTAVCGRIERLYGIPTLSLVCAGHAQPILIRDGRATEIGAKSPMIGVDIDGGRSATHHELRSGDIVIAYTDGLTECVDPRLSSEDLLDRIPVNVSVEAVVDTLMRVFDGAPDGDDGVAVLGFEVR